MDEAIDIALEGLRKGLRARVASLFEVMSSPTVGADSGAEHFRKSIAECLERYKTAEKIIEDILDV